MLNKLSIVIPAYNEGDTIQFILQKVVCVSLIHGIQKEIILVNDHSCEHTEASIFAFIEQNPQLDIKYRTRGEVYNPPRTFNIYRYTKSLR